MGLSVDRLALVERYMIDAEVAEARAKSTADVARLAEHATEKRAQRDAEELQHAAQEGAQREAEGLQRAAQERARREETGLVLGAARTGFEVDDVADQPARTTAKHEARTPKALAKAERRAAKHSARVVAAMEKKEARERKALAKAAAKREAHARKALTRSIVRP